MIDRHLTLIPVRHRVAGRECILVDREIHRPGRDARDERLHEGVSVQSLSPHVMVMHVRYGYMESPHLPPALVAAKKLGLKFDIMQTSFFLGRRSLKASPRSGMPLWQDRLFISLSKNAADATEFFQIPSDRVIELGTQVTI